MLERIRGRVVRLAFDDVNTDVIAPGEFRAQIKENDRNLTALRPHVMRDLRPGLNESVRAGDVFVVGKNFGSGSHREEAVRIFQVWGVQAVVTESAARLWFRNAIAAGLPVFELENATKLFDEGEEIEIDMRDWQIRNVSRGDDNHPVARFPETVMGILDAGGILPLLKSRIENELRAKGPAKQ